MPYGYGDPSGYDAGFGYGAQSGLSEEDDEHKAAMLREALKWALLPKGAAGMFPGGALPANILSAVGGTLPPELLEAAAAGAANGAGAGGSLGGGAVAGYPSAARAAGAATAPDAGGSEHANNVGPNPTRVSGGPEGDPEDDDDRFDLREAYRDRLKPDPRFKPRRPGETVMTQGRPAAVKVIDGKRWVRRSELRLGGGESVLMPPSFSRPFIVKGGQIRLRGRSLGGVQSGETSQSIGSVNVQIHVFMPPFLSKPDYTHQLVRSVPVHLGRGHFTRPIILRDKRGRRINRTVKVSIGGFSGLSVPKGTVIEAWAPYD